MSSTSEKGHARNTFHNPNSPCPSIASLATSFANRDRPRGSASRRCPVMRSIVAWKRFIAQALALVQREPEVADGLVVEMGRKAPGGLRACPSRVQRGARPSPAGLPQRPNGAFGNVDRVADHRGPGPQAHRGARSRERRVEQLAGQDAAVAGRQDDVNALKNSEPWALWTVMAKAVSCSGRRLGASGRVPPSRCGKWTGGRCRPRQCHIAVEDAHRVVVRRDQDRAPASGRRPEAARRAPRGSVR